MPFVLLLLILIQFSILFIVDTDASSICLVNSFNSCLPETASLLNHPYGSGSNEVDFGLRISYKSDLKLLIKKLICLTRFSRFTGKKLLEAMLLEY